MEREVTETEFRTTELSLAAYLHSQGYSHVRLELLDRRTAAWVFKCDASEAAEEFHDGVAEVEPKDFTQKLGRLRKELYVFLDERSAV